MKIESIPIDKINPAPYNPRVDLKPGDHDYEALKNSLKAFDLVEPLIWNVRSGNLVGGHQRFKILKNELKKSEVDVSVVDLDEESEKALNIALNRIQGGWEMDKLATLLKAFSPDKLALTGFKEIELAKITGMPGQNMGQTGADTLPAKPELLCQPGDVWELGPHRLVCGDSKAPNAYSVLRRAGVQASMVFTDPPYNVDYEGYTEEELKIAGDKMALQEFYVFLETVFKILKGVVKDFCSLYVCHPSRFQVEFQAALEQAGFEIRNQIIWVKNTFGWGFGRYKFQHEPIFYAHVKGRSDIWYGDKSQSTVWYVDKPSANREHPTMKPVELIMKALINSSKPGDLIVDPFGGSGSTLIACEKMNRKAFLIEIDPKYCDVILSRYKSYTGRDVSKICFIESLDVFS